MNFKSCRLVQAALGLFICSLFWSCGSAIESGPGGDVFVNSASEKGLPDESQFLGDYTLAFDVDSKEFVIAKDPIQDSLFTGFFQGRIGPSYLAGQLVNSNFTFQTLHAVYSNSVLATHSIGAKSNDGSQYSDFVMRRTVAYPSTLSMTAVRYNGPYYEIYWGAIDPVNWYYTGLRTQTPSSVSFSIGLQAFGTKVTLPDAEAVHIKSWDYGSYQPVDSPGAYPTRNYRNYPPIVFTATENAYPGFDGTDDIPQGGTDNWVFNVSDASNLGTVTASFGSITDIPVTVNTNTNQMTLSGVSLDWNDNRLNQPLIFYNEGSEFARRYVTGNDIIYNTVHAGCATNYTYVMMLYDWYSDKQTQGGIDCPTVTATIDGALAFTPITPGSSFNTGFYDMNPSFIFPSAFFLAADCNRDGWIRNSDGDQIADINMFMVIGLEAGGATGPNSNRFVDLSDVALWAPYPAGCPNIHYQPVVVTHDVNPEGAAVPSL